MQPGMLTPAQLRAARALLGWSRDDLAVKSRTALETVQGFGSRGANSRSSTLLKWQRALGGGWRWLSMPPTGRGRVSD